MTSGCKKTICLLIIVFLIGCGIGIILSRTLIFPPVSPKQEKETPIADFTKKFNLSPKQQNALRAIMVEAKKEVTELRKQLCPQIKLIRHNTIEKIRAILDEKQLPKFDAYIKEQRDDLDKFVKEKFHKEEECSADKKKPEKNK